MPDQTTKRLLDACMGHQIKCDKLVFPKHRTSEENRTEGSSFWTGPVSQLWRQRASRQCFLRFQVLVKGGGSDVSTTGTAYVRQRAANLPTSNAFDSLEYHLSNRKGAPLAVYLVFLHGRLSLSGVLVCHALMLSGSSQAGDHHMGPLLPGTPGPRQPVGGSNAEGQPGTALLPEADRVSKSLFLN